MHIGTDPHTTIYHDGQCSPITFHKHIYSYSYICAHILKTNYTMSTVITQEEANSEMDRAMQPTSAIPAIQQQAMEDITTIGTGESREKKERNSLKHLDYYLHVHHIISPTSRKYVNHLDISYEDLKQDEVLFQQFYRKMCR